VALQLTGGRGVEEGTFCIYYVAPNANQ
jgi:hypothetical protein